MSRAVRFVSLLSGKMYDRVLIILADDETSAPSSPVFPTELRDKPAQTTVKPKGY